MRGLEHLATDHGAPHLDIADRHRVDIERRVGEHSEIGELAGFDGPDSWSMCNWNAPPMVAARNASYGVIFS